MKSALRAVIRAAFVVNWVLPVLYVLEPFVRFPVLLYPEPTYRSYGRQHRHLS